MAPMIPEKVEVTRRQAGIAGIGGLLAVLAEKWLDRYYAAQQESSCQVVLGIMTEELRTHQQHAH